MAKMGFKINGGGDMSVGIQIGEGCCACCDSVIPLKVEIFKSLYCAKCEQFQEECNGADEITLCKHCCELDFIAQGNANSRAFMGVMNDHKEDREETDLP